MDAATVGIIAGIILFLVGVIQGLFFWILNKLDARVESLASEIDKVRTNYIGQFKDVRESLHNTEVCILKKIDDLFESIDNKFMRK